MLQVDIRLELAPFPLQVSFSADRRLTSIFGASGAGKTSLLEVIAGLRRDAKGRVVYEGEIWLDTDAGLFVPPEERRVGYVPQDGLLFPHLDVRANLLSGSARRGRAPEADSDLLRRITQLLEIEGLLERSVGGLSGGERQRVALARAVCSAPRLLVLDEPLASLDLPLRRRILPFLRRLRDELDLPFLHVSHDPLEVQALCEEVVVLRRGAVVAQGAVADVLTDPGVHPLVRDEGFENLLVGTACAAEGGAGEVELCAGVRLKVPSFVEGVGESVLVGVPAQQILVAVERPRGLSAQNYLRCRIRSVRSVEGLEMVLAAVAAEGPELVAEVTPQARKELDLEVGREVFFVVKQTGCRVYSRGATRATFE